MIKLLEMLRLVNAWKENNTCHRENIRKNSAIPIL